MSKEGKIPEIIRRLISGKPLEPAGHVENPGECEPEEADPAERAEEAEPTGEAEPETETAGKIAKRNAEKILAYCETHKYHLLSDRQYSLNVPSWVQRNLLPLVQQREEGEIHQTYGIYVYFAIEKHEIKLLVEYYAEGKGRQQLYLPLTEPSELAETLLPFLVDKWRGIKEWLKEPEELLQKFLTFDPEQGN